MSDITDFQKWWLSHDPNILLKMSKGDCEYTWLSRGNQIHAAQVQARHAEEVGYLNACIKIARMAESQGLGDFAKEVRDLTNKHC